jgi:hypothetical protein
MPSVPRPGVVSGPHGRPPARRVRAPCTGFVPGSSRGLCRQLARRRGLDRAPPPPGMPPRPRTPPLPSQHRPAPRSTGWRIPRASPLRAPLPSPLDALVHSAGALFEPHSARAHRQPLPLPPDRRPRLPGPDPGAADPAPECRVLRQHRTRPLGHGRADGEQHLFGLDASRQARPGSEPERRGGGPQPAGHWHAQCAACAASDGPAPPRDPRPPCPSDRAGPRRAASGTARAPTGVPAPPQPGPAAGSRCRAPARSHRSPR